MINPRHLEHTQNELKLAFKWMGQATQDMKKGETDSAVYCMIVALQHWTQIQHNRDKYISDDDAETINWDFFTYQAMEKAREELRKGDEDDNII